MDTGVDTARGPATEYLHGVDGHPEHKGSLKMAMFDRHSGRNRNKLNRVGGDYIIAGNTDWDSWSRENREITVEDLIGEQIDLGGREIEWEKMFVS